MTRESFLPYCLPSLGEEEVMAVTEVLKSGWLSSGPKVEEFEDRLREYIGCEHVVAVSSCTAALHLSLMAHGIKPGDEVITTPYTFASTGNMIIQMGAKPILADISTVDFNIDPNEIASKIGPKTRAIMPVHFAGHPCDMKEIREIADEHDLSVIEDAAHAIGAEYRGRKIGSQGTACFSFYPTKNMTTGEGGAICTDDDEIAKKVRLLLANGINRNTWQRSINEASWYYDIERCGWKYNMSDLNATIGIEQLKKLDEFIETRIKMAEAYNKALFDVDGIFLPMARGDVKHVYHLYPILLKEPESRNDFIEAMRWLNIGCSVHFIPLHLHTLYQESFHYKQGDFPKAEWVFNREVSLPLYPKMTVQDQKEVIEAVMILLP